jgi:hypothetical protein
MITLRCTRKLLDRLGIPAAELKVSTAPTNALGDWYVNLLRFGREQVVMATSERSLLTVFLPAREVRHRLVPELLDAVREALRQLDVPDEIASREIAAMQPMAFGVTASRSVLASMNNFAQMAEMQWNRDHSPWDIAGFLWRTPMSALEGEGGWMGYPADTARVLLGLPAKRPAPRLLLRLRITLEGTMPRVWRRLLVPEAIKLRDLHRAFQFAMGWTDSHLHEFQFGRARYGTPDPEFPDTGIADERGKRLTELLEQHGVKFFRYVYDFGDGWEHRVDFEGAVENAEGLAVPTCTEGANACPPEDVGGLPGYLEFLAAVRDPMHPEHRAMVEWAGGRFDPAAWDITKANMRLRIAFAM